MQAFSPSLRAVQASNFTPKNFKAMEPLKVLASFLIARMFKFVPFFVCPNLQAVSSELWESTEVRLRSQDLRWSKQRSCCHGESRNSHCSLQSEGQLMKLVLWWVHRLVAGGTLAVVEPGKWSCHMWRPLEL